MTYYFMKTKTIQYLFFFCFAGYLFLLTSCQQESGGGGTIQSQKPKLGTRWVYRYSTYNPQGNFQSSMNVVYKAVTEETLGGESWLKIIDSATSTTIFYLKEKTGGLYIYANNSSNLLCKYPAAINDTYTSFNGADTANYTVTGVNDILSLGVIGDVVVTDYEGTKTGQTVDKLWYSTKMWIVQRYFYRKLLLGTYYRYATLILQDFSY